MAGIPCSCTQTWICYVESFNVDILNRSLPLVAEPYVLGTNVSGRPGFRPHTLTGVWVWVWVWVWVQMSYLM